MTLAVGMHAAILLLHGRVCRYCGAQADSVDHVIPLRQGGSDEAENLTAACKKCNSTKKHNRLPPATEKEIQQESRNLAAEADRLASLFKAGKKAAVKRTKIPVDGQYLMRFVSEDGVKASAAPTISEAESEKKRREWMLWDLTGHGLLYRSINVLNAHGVMTVKQLLALSKREITGMERCGKKTQQNIQDALQSYLGSRRQSARSSGARSKSS